MLCWNSKVNSYILVLCECTPDPRDVLNGMSSFSTTHHYELISSITLIHIPSPQCLLKSRKGCIRGTGNVIKSVLICESCNYIRLSTHTESVTLRGKKNISHLNREDKSPVKRKEKKNLSRTVTPLFYFSWNKHKLKGKVQRCLLPSDNGYTWESWSLTFHLGSTTQAPSDQHPTSWVFLWAWWESSRVSGLPMLGWGCWRKWQMSEGEQGAAQVPLCLCCWGWHLLLWHRWPGPAALGAAGLGIAVPARGCSRAHTWRFPGSAPQPGAVAALGGRCQLKETAHGSHPHSYAECEI